MTRRSLSLLRSINPAWGIKLSATQNFKAWLTKARSKSELTYKGLADKSDISAGTIHAIEHGDSSPSLDTVDKLCKALGTSVEAALRVRPNKPPVEISAINSLSGD